MMWLGALAAENIVEGETRLGLGVATHYISFALRGITRFSMKLEPNRDGLRLSPGALCAIEAACFLQFSYVPAKVSRHQWIRRP